MEDLDDGEMDKTVPLLKPQPRPLTVPRKHFDLFDVRSKFVSTIRISAKKLHEKLKLSEDQKLSGQFDILNVSLSNSKISISSLVKISSPISFGAYHNSISRSLMTMARAHKEIRRIALAYQPEEKQLIIL
ncbi:hypothetical protein MKW94_015726, partial [Papaver nudicaule]|nr:hypothetical protein [Papaver nudicaule]